jgi:hypothetical protein
VKLIPAKVIKLGYQPKIASPLLNFVGGSRSPVIPGQGATPRNPARCSHVIPPGEPTLRDVSEAPVRIELT